MGLVFKKGSAKQSSEAFGKGENLRAGEVTSKSHGFSGSDSGSSETGYIDKVMEKMNSLGMMKVRESFSQANLIGYLFPGASLSAVFVVDLLVYSKASGQTLGGILSFLGADGVSATYSLVLVGASLFLCFGWLMYLTKFYKLFAGYPERKRQFRVKVTKCFSELIELDEDDKVDLGRFLYARTWKLIGSGDRQELLNAHVKWVALVHLTNGIATSVGLQFLALFWLVNDSGSEVSPLLISMAVQLLLFWYFRDAALERLVDCDRIFFEKVQLFQQAIRSDELVKKMLGKYDKNV